MTVRFGCFVPQGWRMDLAEINDPVEQFEAMTNVAKAADAGPWDSIWVYDHFHTVPNPSMETTFECWTITSTLVRDTSRVKVGQMVTCNGYRQPSLMAKMASTVDVASHGRLYFGYGAGWYEHEWDAYGFGFPELKQRMGMFREGVEIIYRMWTEEKPEFHGKYYTIDGPINQPKGVQQPHIPLWIGGSGEQVTLKLVARFGDASNFGGTPDNVPTSSTCSSATATTSGATSTRSLSRATCSSTSSTREPIRRRRPNEPARHRGSPTTNSPATRSSARHGN